MKKVEERLSKTDIAYAILSKSKVEIDFYDLWEDVKKEVSKYLTAEEANNLEDDISFFYTNLTLDGRFVNLGDNKWNLRERVKYDEAHKEDLSDLYIDDEEDEEQIDSDLDEDSSSSYTNPDNLDDSFNDSTGSDADIDSYRDVKSDDEEEF